MRTAWHCGNVAPMRADAGALPGYRHYSAGAARLVSRSMAPWSKGDAPAVSRQKGHSLVFDTGTIVPEEAVFLEYRERSGTVLAPSRFRAPTARLMSTVSSEELLPIVPLGLRRIPARSNALRRCAARSRRCSPRRRFSRGRRATARSPATGSADRAPCSKPPAPMSPAVTASGAFSTRGRPARQWRS